MPSRPIEAHHKNASRTHLPHVHPRTTGQHGKAHSLSHGESILLRFPSESLTHVTSFLDPDALVALSATNRQLHAHVKDDNTWRRAYVYQFLGISPESDLRDNVDRKSLMLRREETTWRREFISRYNLRRRWERSRNQPVTHVPHHSNVASMHLMPNTTLLTASLQYGIVARSYPLTGKILRGYLDASGAANGLGHGNPNLEFSPHVTAIALASEGRTAKVLWGFRNGEVAVTTSVRAMDGNRPSAAKHARCKAEDCHEAALCTLAWSTETGQEGSTFFVTGDAHGQVKLWDTKRMKCLWASAKKEGLERDVCAKVAVDITRGVVIAAMESNNILVWSGFNPVITGERDILEYGPSEVVIPPFPAFGAAQASVGFAPLRELLDIHATTPREGMLRLFVAYKHDPYLYRIDIDFATAQTDRSAFGDGSAGSITAVKPMFVTQEGESSFVLVGNQLGGISIFDCDTPSPAGKTSIIPRRKIDAHEDGAVTALTWNTIVLASGSSRGTVKVWDSLSLTHLRTFPSPGARPAVGGEWDGVSQILLERTVLLASVGSRVMAWQAGPISKHDKVKGKQVRAARNPGLAKWQQQIEMYRDIAESRRDLDEEQSQTRRVFGREREQQSTLAHLGLSEVEAVEYVLMLSRDEEQDRRLQRALGTPEDDGVFMADFDDLQTPLSGPSAFIENAPSPAMSSRTSSYSSHSNGGNIVINGRSLPRTLPSQSNNKIQVSPRIRPEPMEAGFATSPLSGSLPSSLNTQTSISVPSTTDLDHFPPVSRTPSSTGLSVPSTPASPSGGVRVSGTGSSESFRNAWAMPLSSRQSSSSAPSPTPASVMSSPLLVARQSSPPNRALSTGPSLISAGFARQSSRSFGSPELAPLTEGAGREDIDLRFAIELSLAEARSRGDDI